MILTCIAVDDEPPALGLVGRFIDQTPFLKLEGSYTNAIDALRHINEKPVDVVFLDIQMPDLSGVELARILNGRNAVNAPSIIFTTAFDQFALEGYKLEAVDYLLKPFSYEEFMRAANKTFKWAQLKQSNRAEPTAVLEEDYLYLKVEFQTVKIACNNITYIEGLKDYAKIHLADAEKSILSLITLKALEEKLPKGKFMRIHKSFIISLGRVTAVTKNAVYLGSFMIPVSDQFRDEFNKFTGNWR